MTRRSLVGQALACPLLRTAAFAQAPAPRPHPIDTPFDVVLPVPPTAFQADGQTHLADAAVVAVKDGIPENVPGANSRAAPITLETVGGNHVILELGAGHYGFYAHLRPGQIRVRPGDWVKRGQVLGLAGNSGNSTEPHLHFHVCDANSPVVSEALPYAFTSFDVQGQGGVEKAHGAWKPLGAPSRRSNEPPLQNHVVRFS